MKEEPKLQQVRLPHEKTDWLTGSSAAEGGTKFCLVRKSGFPGLITYSEGPMRLHNNPFLCYSHGFPEEKTPNCQRVTGQEKLSFNHLGQEYFASFPWQREFTRWHLNSWLPRYCSAWRKVMLINGFDDTELLRIARSLQLERTGGKILVASGEKLEIMVNVNSTK